MSRNVLFVLLLATGVVLADDVPKAKRAATATEGQAKKEEDAKKLDGMSILGNQEAPKSLVISRAFSKSPPLSAGWSLLHMASFRRLTRVSVT